MTLTGLVFLLASFSSGEIGESNRSASIERVVVVLGQNDPVVSSRVLRAMDGCTERMPTAVVSASRGFRVQRDFATEPGFSLAESLSGKESAAARTLGAALMVLVEALGPRAPSTAIVVVSAGIGPDSEPFPATSGVVSPANRSTDDEPTSEGEAGFADTPEIPDWVYAARRAVRSSGSTLIAVNTSGRYDAGLKTLTEVTKGKYLHPSQKKFAQTLVSVVCGRR